MMNLNVNVVMKNVHDALPHMIERGTGDIVGDQLAGGPLPHPVGAGVRLVQVGHRLLRADRAGVRCSSTASGSDRCRRARSSARCWPTGRRPGSPKRRRPASLIEPDEVADAIVYMLTRAGAGVTIRDMIIMPSAFDL